MPQRQVEVKLTKNSLGSASASARSKSSALTAAHKASSVRKTFIIFKKGLDLSINLQILDYASLFLEVLRFRPLMNKQLDIFM